MARRLEDLLLAVTPLLPDVETAQHYATVRKQIAFQSNMSRRRESRVRFPGLNVWWLHASHPDAAFASMRGLSFGERFSRRWPIDLLIYSFIAAATLAYRWMLQAANSAAARVRAEQQLAAAQLQAMKSRLHPHFLFNTLHTIKALVEREPARAERMIQNLSELLRLTLDRHDQQMTTVAGELEAVRLYLAIQQERFGERLSVAESIGERALQCLVPDMLLQPIAENAVLHGIAPLRRGGEVSDLPSTSATTNGEVGSRWTAETNRRRPPEEVH